MDEDLIIPLAAIMLPMFLVPTIMTMVHRLKKREWEHKERLRSIELGIPVPEQDSRLGGGSVTAIGAGVPVAAIGAALLTTSLVPYDHEEFVPVLAIAWGCAFLISGAALVTSLVLGIMLMRSRGRTDSPDAIAKPAFEPDAFDVVSTRG